MRSLSHEKFILTPIFNILKEASLAIDSLNVGIESHTLRDSIMQSTVLRMTGASEQKLKCIMWEIASYDFTFRYENIFQKPLGECSSYDDKKKMFKAICDMLEENDIQTQFDANIKNSIIDKAHKDLVTLLTDSAFEYWYERDFKVFIESPLTITTSTFVFGESGKLQLIGSVLQEFYKKTVYRQRNRYAHNLLSYQMNVPTLTTLADKNYESANHFKIFSMLILLDEIFMELFRRFMMLKNEHTY